MDTATSTHCSGMLPAVPPQPSRLLTAGDLEAILDSLVEGIVTLDSGRRITGINRAACEILGVDKTEALHRDCRGLFGERFCAQASPIHQAVEQDQSVENLMAQLDTPHGPPKMLNFRTGVLRDAGGRRRDTLVVFRDVTELVTLKADLKRRYRLHNIVGKSKSMQEVFELVEEVADSEASVLIHGESGTGKELVARAIHHLGHRSDGPFVAVNCSALAEGLLESELFGHVEGAFTGAVRDKRGRFEAAAGGTIFLDEIGDLAPGIQVKLLRVLQQRVIERVGSDEPVAVDIRVIAATHRSLAEMVDSGRFRQDLYYRLRVVPIELPALRRRRDDLPLLTQHFVDKFAKETGRPIDRVGPDALTLLIDYAWPGNVRELENAIEYAFVKCRSGEIQPTHLPPELRSPRGGVSAPAACEVRCRIDPAHDEREVLRGTLATTGWNVARAARRLGMSRTTLYDRIHRFGLKRPKE